MEIYFQRCYHVYILSNRAKSRLITGVTGDLPAKLSYLRYADGQEAREAGFYLVYKERFPDVRVAMEREEAINKLSMKKKLQLITEVNPLWELLSMER